MKINLLHNETAGASFRHFTSVESLREGHLYAFDVHYCLFVLELAIS